jgi:galactan 5-O-arabinofuranosyltransferase
VFLVPLIAVVLAAAFWVVATLSDVDPVGPQLPVLFDVSAFVLVCLLVAFALDQRGGRAWADTVVGSVAGFATGAMLVGLRGTAWGLWGLYGDQGFRTENVTRFAQTPAFVDYGYLGLPAHYPPLLFWIEGRTAALLHLPAWQSPKLVETVLAGLIPIVAYALWRRLLTPPMAALVVVASTFLAADLYKPDEWLVLAWVLPWWLDAFRDIRAPGARRWPIVVHGAIAGCLLMAYTYYFLPLALATVIGLVLDVVARREWRHRVARTAGIVGVGLVVSAVYWLPLVAFRLEGRPYDAWQLRWSAQGKTPLPLPLGFSVLGVVMAVGVVFLVLRTRRHPLAEGLALIVAGGYVMFLGGTALAVLGHPILAFKSAGLIQAGWAIAGVLGLAKLWQAIGAAAHRGRLQKLTAPVSVALLAVLGMFSAGSFVHLQVAGKPVAWAHNQPYPSGALPDFSTDPTLSHRPSVHAVYRAVHAGLPVGCSPVVVTNRIDLLATTTLHPFTPWASIYSNPYGQFSQRLRFLRKLAGSHDPAAFARRLRHNRFSPIYAFVGRVRHGDLIYQVRFDNYPKRRRRLMVAFPVQLFGAGQFRVSRVSQVLVATLRHAAGTACSASG